MRDPQQCILPCYTSHLQDLPSKKPKIMAFFYDLYNNDSSPIIDPEVCLLTVVLVFKPRELEIKVFTYAEDFSVIPTSKKLQFDVVTQLAPAIFISLCITASLFLSVSNENILLSKTKKRKGIC